MTCITVRLVVFINICLSVKKVKKNRFMEQEDKRIVYQKKIVQLGGWLMSFEKVFMIYFNNVKSEIFTFLIIIGIMY